MNDKYTFRDFLVYFMSGIIGVFILLINFREGLSGFVNTNKDLIKDADTVILLLSIPLFYFIGHIIHGVDTLLFYAGRPLRELSEKCICLKPFNLVINGHRVSNTLHQKKLDYVNFWKECAKLQNKKLFGASEYWYVLNDFFKGIYVVTWIAIIISIKNLEYCIALAFLMLNFLFWMKARMYAHHFVNTVNNTVSVIEE